MGECTYIRHFQLSKIKNDEKIEIFIEICYICLKSIRNLVLKE